MDKIDFVISVLEALPDLIKAGEDVISIIEGATASLKKMQEEGRDPLPEEWDALNQMVEGLRSQLQSESSE